METKEKNAKGLVETAHKARKETEHFLNRWINDYTKGWSVRSLLVKDYKEHYSNLLAYRCILSLSAIVYKEKRR